MQPDTSSKIPRGVDDEYLSALVPGDILLHHESHLGGVGAVKQDDGQGGILTQLDHILLVLRQEVFQPAAQPRERHDKVDGRQHFWGVHRHHILVIGTEDRDPLLDTSVAVRAPPEDEIEDELAASHGVDPMVPVLQLVENVALVLREALVGQVDGFGEPVPRLLSYASDDASGGRLVHYRHQPRLVEILPVVDLEFVLWDVARSYDDPVRGCWGGRVRGRGSGRGGLRGFSAGGELGAEVGGDEGVCVFDDVSDGSGPAHGGVVLQLFEVAVQAVHVLGVFDGVDHDGLGQLRGLEQRGGLY